jgi:hypothetical protein
LPVSLCWRMAGSLAANAWTHTFGNLRFELSF